jgi:Sec-independent protein translocase protein TatA
LYAEHGVGELDRRCVRITGIGSIEVFVVIFLVVVCVGPGTAQKMIRVLGRIIRVFRKTVQDLKSELAPINDIANLIDIEDIKDVKKEIENAADALSAERRKL